MWASTECRRIGHTNVLKTKKIANPITKLYLIKKQSPEALLKYLESSSWVERKNKLKKIELRCANFQRTMQSKLWRDSLSPKHCFPHSPKQMAHFNLAIKWTSKCTMSPWLPCNYNIKPYVLWNLIRTQLRWTPKSGAITWKTRIC